MSVIAFDTASQDITIRITDTDVTIVDVNRAMVDPGHHGAEPLEIAQGSLRDNVKRLSDALNIKQVVWSGIADCIDWSVHANYKLTSHAIPEVFSSLLEQYPLTSVYWSTNGVLEIRPTIHLKECEL